MQMEVREGMSSVVLTVGPGHTLREAARRMTEKGVGAAVVIDEEAPGPGVVSERDILNSLGRGEDPDAERVGDHMTDTVISAAPDWSLERAAVGDVAAPHPPPRGRRGRRAGRRALDARHRARLDLRGRDLGHDLARGRAATRSLEPRSDSRPTACSVTAPAAAAERTGAGRSGRGQAAGRCCAAGGRSRARGVADPGRRARPARRSRRRRRTATR